MKIPFVCPSCGLYTESAARYAEQTGECRNCSHPITLPAVAVMEPPATNSSSWGRVFEWGVALLIVGVLVVLLVPSSGTPRESRRRVACCGHLQKIGYALHNYHDTFIKFPPSYTTDAQGRPLHSWRVLILPYLERRDIYDQLRLDEPWNSPHNWAILRDEPAPDCYRCVSNESDNLQETHYLAVVGPNAAMGETKPTSMSHIIDGTSNTLIVLEVGRSNIHWAAPGDLSSEKITLNGALGQPRSKHPGGFHGLLCDGSVCFIDSNIDRETLRRLLNRHDGQHLGDWR